MIHIGYHSSRQRRVLEDVAKISLRSVWYGSPKQPAEPGTDTVDATMREPVALVTGNLIRIAIASKHTLITTRLYPQFKQLQETNTHAATEIEPIPSTALH